MNEDWGELPSEEEIKAELAKNNTDNLFENWWNQVTEKDNELSGTVPAIAVKNLGVTQEDIDAQRVPVPFAHLGNDEYLTRIIGPITNRIREAHNELITMLGENNLTKSRLEQQRALVIALGKEYYKAANGRCFNQSIVDNCSNMVEVIDKKMKELK